MGRKPRIGLALGGGAARGWAHIGVLRYLESVGIRPEVVCGTSIGAIVGGAEVSGRLGQLEDWVRTLEWRDIVAFLDVSFNGGLIEGGKLIEFFAQYFQDCPIESLDRPYGAVATDLFSGQEVWLNEGSLYSAIRASIALPGLFTPVRQDERWLVDGGLANPVPVSLCRALGADRIIAVDLNADLLTRTRHRLRPPTRSSGRETAEEKALGELLRKRDWRGLFSAVIAEPAGQWRNQLFGNGNGAPSLIDVVAQSVYIMQVRLTRARMAGDPPDVLLTPRLAHIRLMEFHRASEAIDEGWRAAERAAESLTDLLEY
ncbi:patatin-like phospholipase family protein [Thiohalobacter sp.]|uniref:patatin-like phospholipase family protein n=1 Tax=Thiohalobacter sp. TaxID=2025948 RepID=UPI002632516F|nr:patatin-like phospholipase family protein [Thiohalobacter sp.]